MGIVQGLTEFLPISSSGHLILVPYLFGWDDPFITSLAFRVMLHVGHARWRCSSTSATDWLRLRPGRLRDHPRPLVPRRPGPPARLAARRGDDPGGASPASSSTTSSRSASAQPGLVAVMLVVGAVILWLADRWGAPTKSVDELSFPSRLRHRRRPGARADPGRQPLGHLDLGGPVRRARPRGRRAVQLPDGDADHGGRRSPTRALKLVRGEAGWPTLAAAGRRRRRGVRVRASSRSRFLLRYVRTQSFGIFVVYRIVLAGRRHRRLPAAIGRRQARPWRS